MKYSIQNFLLLTITTIIFFNLACSQTGKDGSGSSNANIAETAKNQTSESNSANIKETPKTELPKQSDLFDAFKKGDDYKANFRPKILNDGWLPARSEEGKENCASIAKLCEEYPELEGGPAAKLGNMIFRWKKGDKVLLIFTLDSPPLLENYQFEKSSKSVKEDDLLGKFECCEIGISGVRTLEFKSGNSVIFNEKDEGSTASGKGSWKWDSKSEVININLTINSKYDDGESVETKTSNVSFQLKKDGKDLKIVKETLSPPNLSGYYIGKTFKRL